MAYIITEPCIGTKDSACVDVCPVDCIHPRKDEPDFEAETQLYIHPDECIDCGACVPACPVEAIFALDEVPEKWKNYIAEFKMDWPQFHDERRQVIASFRVSAYPTSVVIGGDGIILLRESGGGIATTRVIEDAIKKGLKALEPK